jgi:stage V sporulation protein G
MKITEVRIFPTESRDGKLKAFATMTFDDWFVVRNVKVIQGNTGLFIAMPSRKAMDPCNKCGFKNVRGSKYCNQCGKELPQKPNFQEDENGEKQGDHMDIAHPITQECRVYLQKEILEAYNKEIGRKSVEGNSYKPVDEKDLDMAAKEAIRSSRPVQEVVPADGVPEPDKDIEL